MATETEQRQQQDTATDSRTRTMVPAVEEDTVLLARWLRRMPFAGDTFASSCRAIEAEPLPPINAKGGRDAEGWTAVYEVTVKPEWVNGMGGLHGAAAAWIVDMFTNTSINRLATDTWNPWGPSINIEMNYYAPAMIGTRLRVETVIERMGASISTCRCLISDATTGRRVAGGMHTTMRPAGRKHNPNILLLPERKKPFAKL
ncbi:hypothetical protein CC85DRAFT_282368 [Cutaneotrichosporon oleaginosum]|uniref:Thioesterase domain-containing protein n=2 Tax=Cutaneotrichosporon oleaginosum TaxID=879819 RepID=A0A0J0XXD5_9TREE|nr:uncharacterized protein CC85DRAFT_282368 [Cutaneotrichosporon oleaginosum]KLT45737.1 hypothetical protein CC85DRAFT_282368 [Cutaneotrichosporon oleaginosum]